MNATLASFGPLAAQLARAGLPTLAAILSDVAPFPLNLFAGPAVSAISAALGVDGAPAATARIAQDPAGAAQALRGVEDEHKAACDAAQAELAARLADVQDARAAEAGLVKAGSPVAWAGPVLSIVVVVAYGGLCVALLFRAVPEGAVASMIYGALSAGFTTVVGYWLGSSRGSAEKTDALAGLVRRTLPAVPVRGRA